MVLRGEIDFDFVTTHGVQLCEFENLIEYTTDNFNISKAVPLPQWINDRYALNTHIM